MPELAAHYSPFRGCIQRETWDMGPYAGADYIPSPNLRSSAFHPKDGYCCFPNYSKMEQPIGKVQGVTMRCRLSWLTNSAPSYMSPNAGCWVSANEYSCAHGA